MTRTSLFFCALDGAKPAEAIVADKEMIDRELRAHNPRLAEKPTILTLNKLDLSDAYESLKRLRERFGEVRGISAATGEGVRDLVYAVWTTIARAPIPEIATLPPARIDLVARDAFRIERATDGAFEIFGERIERLAAMTDFDSDEALARFERVLDAMGVEKKLRELGAREGDTVRIGQYEFTYS